MKKQLKILMLSSLLLSISNSIFAEKADSYIDELSSEAGKTEMKSNANIIITDSDEPVPTATDSAEDTDALAIKVENQLEKLLSGSSKEDVKKEDIANIVSGAVKEGHDIDAIQNAVNDAMAELQKKEDTAIKPEVLKFATDAAVNIVNSSKDVAQGNPNDPYIQDLNAELSINSEEETKSAEIKEGSPSQAKTVDNSSNTHEANNERTIIVLKGESLSKIATKIYGSSEKYHLLYEANKDRISNPNNISVGQILKVPPLPKESTE